MRIHSLHLQNFRNYSDQQVILTDADVQLFVGLNGSGKTNLLEAVSVLSLTRSCRGNDDIDMVQWEKNHFRLRADIVSDAGEKSLIEAVSELKPRKRKATFINDVRSPLSRIIGFLPTVTFLPQDLELFTGPPAERRRFLDQLLSQLSQDYFIALSQYQKILQQRNALLKRIAAGKEKASSLHTWDGELAARGAVITLARLELIETFNLSFLEEMRNLGEQWDDARLRYERKTESRSKSELEEEMSDALEANRERDVMLQSTSIGPHREDWQVYRSGRALPSFASRGQERVAVLAMLLLQVSYLELRKGEKPVVLLDDAFSELDDPHQEALLQGFHGYQVLMTATRVPPKAEGAEVFWVQNGKVSPSNPLPGGEGGGEGS